MKSLDLEVVSKCRLCPMLGKDHVPSYGSPTAEVMLIGQSPGQQEVEQGEPFVGPSGELIDYMLDEAGLTRADIYIANALKCHPPGNRAGMDDELDNCMKRWLTKEIRIIDPSLVVLLGKDAWKSVTKERFEFKHGNLHRTKKRAYLTVYHPAYFLRRGDMDTFIAIGRTIREVLKGVEHD